jgi:hypothetical protein
MRLCDIALNFLHKNLGNHVDAKVGVGGYGGDAIVADVPLAKRDEWIRTFRAAVIAKYGTRP